MEFNQLVGGRHPEAVRKIFGEDIVLSGVSPELQAAIILENDRVENWLHQSVYPWTAFRSGAALAANNTGVGINNPPTSGLLCVIDTIFPDQIVQQGAVESPRTLLGEIGVGLVVSPLDSRGLLSPPGIFITAFQRAAIPNVQWRQSANVLTPARVILAPGSQVIWWAEPQNTVLNLAARGYARRLKSEEVSA